MSSRPRALIATVDEPLFAPLYVERVLDASPDAADVVAVAALATGQWRGAGEELARRRQMYGNSDLIRFVARMAQAKLYGALRLRVGGRSYSVSQVARRQGVPYRARMSLNAAETRDFLTRQEVDAVFCIGYPEIVGRQTLETPPLGCYNVHSSLLPRYRGFASLYWALVNGDREAGVTVHRMTERIDEGRIIAQERFPIHDSDSLYDLYLRAIEVGSGVVGRAMESVLGLAQHAAPGDAVTAAPGDGGRDITTPHAPDAGHADGGADRARYHGPPGPRERAILRRRGRRLF